MDRSPRKPRPQPSRVQADSGTRRPTPRAPEPAREPSLLDQLRLLVGGPRGHTGK
jgi:hypothetical protein